MRRPVDLGSTLNRLLENHYPTVGHLRSEIDLIWDNAVAYHGAASPTGLAAESLRRMADKRFVTESLPDEASLVTNLRDFLASRGLQYRIPYNATRLTVASSPINLTLNQTSLGAFLLYMPSAQEAVDETLGDPPHQPHAGGSAAAADGDGSIRISSKEEEDAAIEQAHRLGRGYGSGELVDSSLGQSVAKHARS